MRRKIVIRNVSVEPVRESSNPAKRNLRALAYSSAPTEVPTRIVKAMEQDSGNI